MIPVDRGELIQKHIEKLEKALPTLPPEKREIVEKGLEKAKYLAFVRGYKRKAERILRGYLGYVAKLVSRRTS